MTDTNRDGYMIGAVFTILISILIVAAAAVICLQLLHDYYRPGYNAAFEWRNALAAFVALFGVLLGAEYAHRRTAVREATAFERLRKKEFDDRSNNLLLSHMESAVVIEAILMWVAEIAANFLSNEDASAIFGDANDQRVIDAHWQDETAEQICRMDIKFVSGIISRAPILEVNLARETINFLNNVNYFQVTYADKIGTIAMKDSIVEKDLRKLASATARAHKTVREFRERGWKLWAA